MEFLDVVDENGIPAGEVVARAVAHAEGIRHRTAHVWIARKKENGFDILLQKRSMEKESFPGYYDTSSAGHIPAGEEPLPSALRELQEELGITASEEDLQYVGMFHIGYEKEFHGKPFKDNEVTRVYVYSKPVNEKELILQASEVDEVRWFNLEEVWKEIQCDRHRFCMPAEGLKLLRDYLRNICEKEGVS